MDIYIIDILIVMSFCCVNITSAKSVYTKPKYTTHSNLQDLNYRVQEFEKSRQDIYKDSTHITKPVSNEPYTMLTGIKDAVEKEGNALMNDILQPIELNHRPEVYDTTSERRKKRQVRLSAIKGLNVWPHNIVPYYIDLDTYSAGYTQWGIKLAVSTGLKYLESVSCVKFIERSTMDAATLAKIGHHHSVKIYNGPGCWSHSGCTGCYLGLQWNTSQSLSLSTKCANDEIVQHEFGHVLGLTHEHTRTDMHKHIAVNYSLVSDPRVFYRKTHPEFINNAPYDLSSIQHYQTSVLVTHNPEDMWLKAGIGKLTHYDEWSINSAYCSERCDKNYCKNDGYMSTKLGGCSCVCPDGLTGASCEQTTTEDLYNCGGTVHLTQHSSVLTLQTPNYPNKYNSNTTCTWLVKAPAGYIIESKITYMDLPADVYGCKHHVEIRDKLIGQVSREKCGKCDNRNCYISKSRSNFALVMFDGLKTVEAGRGAQIEVKMLDDCSSCRGAPCQNGSCSPSGGNMRCGFEQGLLGECSDIRIHDSYQKSYEDLSWTESAWEIAEYGERLTNQNSRTRSAEGRFHLQSRRPAPHTAGPYEGSFRIIPYLIYPGHSRCLSFKLYLCCDRRVSLKVYRSVDGELSRTPLLTLDEHIDQWREIKHTLTVPSYMTRAQSTEIVFISSHSVSSRLGKAHLGVDNIEWSYGRCQ